MLHTSKQGNRWRVDIRNKLDIFIDNKIKARQRRNGPWIRSGKLFYELLRGYKHTKFKRDVLANCIGWD